jgi:raffinose/stachyose/melibiose transport system substrate-binding protein
LGGTSTFYNAYWFLDLSIRTFGAEGLYNTAMNKSDTSFADDPRWLEVAEKVYSLGDNGYLIEGYPGTDPRSAQMLFVNGEAAMINMNAWLPAEMQLEAPEDFDWGFFNFPMVEGGEGEPSCVELKYNGFMIAKDSKHPDEAMLFIKKLTGREVQEASVGVLRPAVLPGLDWPDPLQGTYDVLEAAEETAGFSANLDRDAAEWENNVLYPLDDKLIFNDMEPAEFIEQLQAQHDAYWARQE